MRGHLLFVAAFLVLSLPALPVLAKGATDPCARHFTPMIPGEKVLDYLPLILIVGGLGANALRHNASGGHVAVVLETEEDGFVLKPGDTGGLVAELRGPLEATAS
jgi:hypothetical protein